MGARAAALPSHEAALAALVLAERDEGWLARCDAAGRYVALTAPFVAALADVLRPRASAARPVLEVCAGDGALAAALRDAGVPVVATDARPAPDAESVERLTAREALAAYDPRVVLGAFVPFDAGVDEAVLGHASVREYVIVNARLGGELGARCLWTTPGWRRERLEVVTRSTISRHDVWMSDDAPVRRRGEAWRLSRGAEPTDPAAALPQE